MLFDLDDFYVQVAGVQSEEEALLAIGLGANAVSFDFYPSERQVTARDVFDIVRRLPPGSIAIGTFRNELPQRVTEVVNNLGLRGAEIIGNCTHENLAYVQERVPTLLRGLNPDRMGHAFEIDEPSDYFFMPESDDYEDLVRCWQSLDGAYPTRELILAGLTADTVVDVIQTTPAFGLRVQRGVIDDRGRIDPVALGHFIADARWAHHTSL